MKITIITDNFARNKILIEGLKKNGFKVDIISKLEELKTLPDIILIDNLMNKKIFYSTIEELKSNKKFFNLPVLLIADNYNLQIDENNILKFKIDEIILRNDNIDLISFRLKSLLRMLYQLKDTNPLTNLPGNKAINLKLKNAIKLQDAKKFAILYIDLDNFKAFNDVYGFSEGDRIILFTANLLKEAVELYGNEKDFIGHIGGDDFIIITTPDKVKLITLYIVENFDKKIISFFKPQDVQNNYIIAESRNGEKKKFPLTKISIAVVTNEKQKYNDINELSKVAAELKKRAKAIEGSSVVIDFETDDFVESGLKKSKILIVDDSMYICTFLKSFLTLEGFDVEFNIDPEEALKNLIDKKYDLLIVDIAMPKIDGLTLIELLRNSNGINKNIPIIIISAYSQPRFIQKAKTLHIKDFFVKPFDNKKFLGSVKKILVSQK